MRSLTILTYLIVSVGVGCCIKVISTDEDQLLPPDSSAEILNSSLAAYDEFTVCFRFITYQFTLQQKNWLVIISIGSHDVMSGLITAPCDYIYSGCTKVVKAWVGDAFRYKKVFGYSNFGSEDSNSYYKPWQPGVWNSGCITASKPRGFLYVNMNGEAVGGTEDYNGFYQDTDRNIVLMNNYYEEPNHGAVTDVNVWSRVLSQQEIKAWSHCETTILPDILTWKKVELNITKLNVSELDKEVVCLQKPVDRKYIGFNVKLNFEGTIKFCGNIGGNFAMGRNMESLEEISRVFEENCRGGPRWLYTGFTDTDTAGSWADFRTGERMALTNWAPQHPRNYADHDCVLYNTSSRTLVNRHCTLLTCPVCQVSQTASNFILRGVCVGSSIDSLFLMKSTTEFLGFIQTKIIFTSTRWEIVNITNTAQVLASMVQGSTNNYPIGLHRWFIKDSNCTDPGSEFRSLNLHLEVDQPGNFCCNDGTCIDSELVCNNFPDCEEAEDETNCTFIHLPRYHDDLERPPVEYNKGKIKQLVLNGTFNVLKLFEINDVDSIFDLYFILEIEWFYKNLLFEYLHYEDSLNYLNETTKHKIWSPEIEFRDTKTVLSRNKEEFVVLRRGRAKLDVDLDSTTQANEVYTGIENPFKIIIERRIQFSCSFDNIKNFPFGKQKCFVEFRVVGAANLLTEINIIKVKNEAATDVGQYVIDTWIVGTDLNNQTGRNIVKVTMILSRKLASIFMVTYLPTILMNMINQATNYISGEDKYSMIYTINITCMMVLASIYLSVSASLPSTSDIKPIEVWLIFNLAYPFITILINVIMQA